jgi:hypothetical protein
MSANRSCDLGVVSCVQAWIPGYSEVVPDRLPAMTLRRPRMGPAQRRSGEFETILMRDGQAGRHSCQNGAGRKIAEAGPALPDLEQSEAAVLKGLSSKSGQRSYDRAIIDFVDRYCSEPRLAFNRTVGLRYRIYLEQKQYAHTPDQSPTGGGPTGCFRRCLLMPTQSGVGSRDSTREVSAPDRSSGGELAVRRAR